MATRNGNIRSYLQPAPPAQPSNQSAKPVTTSPPKSPSSAVTPEPTSDVHQHAPVQFSSQRVIKSSDDEGSESDSDDGLRPLSELLAISKPSSNGLPQAPMTPVRHRKSRKTTNFHASPLAVMSKYKFDLNMLVHQVEKHDATEASALRVKALLADDKAKEPFASNTSSTPNDILGSVLAENEGVHADKILRAVERTEATHTEKGWYFFDLQDHSVLTENPIPTGYVMTSWQESLTSPQTRDGMLLSGFARDMVTFGDSLPDELFVWMLDELCFTSRHDLRQAYCDLLLASSKQAGRLVRPDTITRMFRNLNGKQSSVDAEQPIFPVPEIRRAYEGVDWARLRMVVVFLGQLSEHTVPSTNTHTLLILCRLCADNVVLGNVSLLSAVQDTITRLSKNTDQVSWEISCQDICTSVFSTIASPVLRSQVLRCMPAFSPRPNDLRRRMALSFFAEDLKYGADVAYEVVDLWTMTKLLDGPRFKIQEGTDYHELAALMLILDVALDNGLSANTDMTDHEAEAEFNADIDCLGARIKAIWSSINDSGASFISRIDAKEVMEGVRHRLIYGVRSKARPKTGVFDSVQDKSSEIKKQSSLMDRIFMRNGANGLGSAEVKSAIAAAP